MNTNLLPDSASRVQRNSPDSFNEIIEQQTISHLESVGTDRPHIEARLKELDAEWDIERAIEANASTLILTSMALGAIANKKWFILSAAVAGFLLQHSLQGWCPPVPILRRLGFRTQREIDNERTILLARIDELPKQYTDSSSAIKIMKR